MKGRRCGFMLLNSGFPSILASGPARQAGTPDFPGFALGFNLANGLLQADFEANEMVPEMRRLIVIAVVGLIAGGLAALALRSMPENGEQGQVVSGQALIGGPFSLVDQTGKRVTDADFKGRYMLVMFGFTNCPDICPAGLQVMTAALDQIGAKAEKVTPVFITVDPERDTQEKMSSYVKSFHPRLVALTGTVDEIKAVTKAYKVYAKKAENAGDPSNYSMDHSSLFYLMDPDGVFAAHFPHTTDAGKLASGLDKAVK
jgi:protein SCO1